MLDPIAGHLAIQLSLPEQRYLTARAVGLAERPRKSLRGRNRS